MKRGSFITDLHVHSNFSDGQLSIPDVVDFYGKRGFGAIAITDHYCESQTFLGKAARYLGKSLTSATLPLYFNILESEAKRAWKTYGMRVIPGLELTKNSVSNHRSAHLLILGVTEVVSADGDVIDIARNARALGALVIAAHPVHTLKREKQTYHLWDRREELAPFIDAWEVASGPHWFKEVQESGLPILANSDFHKPSQIRAWKTRFEGAKTQNSIFKSVKNQNLEFCFYEENDHDEPSSIIAVGG